MAFKSKEKAKYKEVSDVPLQSFLNSAGKSLKTER